MDPRVKTSASDLKVQHDLSVSCYNYIKKCKEVLKSGENAGLSKLMNSFSALQNILHDSDLPPTTQTIKAVSETVAAYEAMMKK